MDSTAHGEPSAQVGADGAGAPTPPIVISSEVRKPADDPAAKLQEVRVYSFAGIGRGCPIPHWTRTVMSDPTNLSCTWLCGWFLQIIDFFAFRPAIKKDATYSGTVIFDLINKPKVMFSVRMIPGKRE